MPDCPTPISSAARSQADYCTLSLPDAPKTIASILSWLPSWVCAESVKEIQPSMSFGHCGSGSHWQVELSRSQAKTVLANAIETKSLGTTGRRYERRVDGLNTATYAIQDFQSLAKFGTPTSEIGGEHRQADDGAGRLCDVSDRLRERSASCS